MKFIFLIVMMSISMGALAQKVSPTVYITHYVKPEAKHPVGEIKTYRRVEKLKIGSVDSNFTTASSVLVTFGNSLNKYIHENDRRPSGGKDQRWFPEKN